MKKIIIRADDLGYSEGINCGIKKAVCDGLINTVGVMTNMEEAANGVRLLNGVNVCFGQHTNICVGKPIIDAKKIPSLVGPDGNFKSSTEYRSAKEDFVVLDEVILEIEAQYERFKEIVGREPEYFEGHAVASANFFKGLEIVAERHGLKYSAMSFDGSPVRVGNTDMYIHIDSMMPDYDPTESIKKMIENAHENACDMYVCHPGYLDAYILKTSSMTTPRPLEVEAVCDPKLREWILRQDVKLVTYNDL